MHDHHDDFGGLHRDLLSTGAAMPRRDALRLAARFGLGMGALNLLGCASSDSGLATTDPTTSTGTCSKIPEETAGPYPGDASNGPNVLNQTGVVRSDIRPSFAGLSGTADGVPLIINLTIVSAGSCAPLAGYAVYLWHCDRLGRYSLYSSGALSQNYLRGVQAADANGKVTFTSVYPGCYAGRWPHIHFEVYPSLAMATLYTNRILTSQLALPRDVCSTVYATSGYSQSVTNLAGVTLANDGIFGDNTTAQNAQMTPAFTGSVAAGYNGSVLVGVPV